MQKLVGITPGPPDAEEDERGSPRRKPGWPDRVGPGCCARRGQRDAEEDARTAEEDASVAAKAGRQISYLKLPLDPLRIHSWIPPVRVGGKA